MTLGDQPRSVFFDSMCVGSFDGAVDSKTAEELVNKNSARERKLPRKILMQTANGTVTTGESIQVDLRAFKKSREVELLVIPKSQMTDGLLLLGAKGMQKFETNLDFTGRTPQIKIRDGERTHSVPMVNCAKLQKLEQAVICKLAAVANEQRHTAAHEWYKLVSQN